MSSDAHYAAMIGDVCRELCGEPNPRLSRPRELRFGAQGSLSVDLDKGTWYDHEAEEGGGVLDLVGRQAGLGARSEQLEWLKARGFEASQYAETTYDYTNENGELLFQVVRRYPKDFRQRRPDGRGGWVYSVKGVQQVPYRLQGFSLWPGETVYVVEGEKDADRLDSLGLRATCNAGGAGKWRPCHAVWLEGRSVVVLPDNDDAGRAHAVSVAASLRGIAADVRILELPGLPPKGDVSDWLDMGHDVAELMALAESAPADNGVLPETEDGLAEVPLDGLMTGLLEAPGFVIHPIVPRRVATLFGGHGGVGKSMLGLTLCAHVACGRGWAGFGISQDRVVYVSLEDEAGVVRYRLRRIIEAYGLPPAEVLENLRVFDGSDIEAELAEERNEAGATRLVFTPMMDTVTAAVAGAGLAMIDNASDAFAGNENARLQVRKFIRRLGKVARTNNAGMILLAHIDKAAAKHGAKDNNYSGSTAWHNSVRSRLALIEADGAIEFIHEKSNWGTKAEPVRVQRVEHGVIVPVAHDGSQESAAALIAAADAHAALKVVREALDAGLTLPTSTSGPAQAHHVLETLPEHPAIFRGKQGRARLAAALVRLSRQGMIVRDDYHKPNRHPGQRWLLAQNASKEAA